MSLIQLESFGIIVFESASLFRPLSTPSFILPRSLFMSVFSPKSIHDPDMLVTVDGMNDVEDGIIKLIMHEIMYHSLDAIGNISQSNYDLMILVVACLLITAVYYVLFLGSPENNQGIC